MRAVGEIGSLYEIARPSARTPASESPSGSFGGEAKGRQEDATIVIDEGEGSV